MNKKENKIYTSQEEDMELVKSFQLENNIEAFDSLVVKYKDLVFTLALRVLGNRDDADDCAQEIFLKVYNNIGQFQYRSQFTTWLYKIAVNTCKNYVSSFEYRFNKRSYRIEEHNNDCDTTIKTFELKDASFTPERILERKEREKLIQTAIDSLPPKQKILIILRDMEGRSYEEIVAITGLKLGTVKSKIARARIKLRKQLKGAL